VIPTKHAAATTTTTTAGNKPPISLHLHRQLQQQKLLV
jgi:hypothetical protein